MLYHFLYKTTNNIDGKFYYGIHSTENINDGYLGSGVILNKAIKKYGRENFSREIIKFCNTREEALILERKTITEDLLRSSECYNITYGGGAGQLFYIPVKDKDGNTFSVSKDDPRYLSGELVGASKNTQWMNNGTHEKMIFENEIENYLKNGWSLGRKQKFWIHNELKSKMIFENEIENYLKNGWSLGRGKVKY